MPLLQNSYVNDDKYDDDHHHNHLLRSRLKMNKTQERGKFKFRVSFV